jgi:hypothetical protein
MASATLASLTEAQASGLDRNSTEKGEALSLPPYEDLKPDTDRVPEAPPTVPTDNEENQWVTGIKLFNIMAAITFVCLLVLLDTSIVATV